MVIADDVFDRNLVVGPAALGGTIQERVAVLEWKAWGRFVLADVLGDAAIPFEIDPFREFSVAEFEDVCESASTVCFQINLSVRRRLPVRIHDLTRRFVDNGLYVVNGLVQDVRKSTLHAHLKSIGLPSLRATQSGPPDEIMFVKTDLNYGGDLERWLSPEDIESAGFTDLISAEMGAYRYWTAQRAEIDESLWSDSAVVVEKYVTNPEGSFYRAYFSGKQIVIVRAFAEGTVKKLISDPRDKNFASELDFLKAGTDRLPLSETLKRDVACFVENTPVEFGCIDIVHDGNDNHYVIDLNLTPSSGTAVANAEINAFLLHGITNPSQRIASVNNDSPLAAT